MTSLANLVSEDFQKMQEPILLGSTSIFGTFAGTYLVTWNGWGRGEILRVPISFLTPLEHSLWISENSISTKTCCFVSLASR